jgi:CHAT domain-containing protein
LRTAQLSLMQQPGYAAPIYWAGFVVEGSWRTP